jgi:hypothetical protein
MLPAVLLQNPVLISQRLSFTLGAHQVLPRMTLYFYEQATSLQHLFLAPCVIPGRCVDAYRFSALRLLGAISNGVRLSLSAIQMLKAQRKTILAAH